MAKLIDLTGQVFGKLTVLKLDDTKKGKNGDKFWICKCECGNVKSIRTYSIRNVDESCGRCNIDFDIEYKYIKRLYHIWIGMIERCNNPNHNSHKIYNDRNINVCNEWLNSLKCFYDWSMANGYDDSLTLDRIDNDKGYSEDNCRWITSAGQQHNRRDNVLNWDLVNKIRNMYNKGNKIANISRKLNINYSTCRSVTSGRSWVHV